MPCSILSDRETQAPSPSGRLVCDARPAAEAARVRGRGASQHRGVCFSARHGELILWSLLFQLWSEHRRKIISCFLVEQGHNVIFKTTLQRTKEQKENYREIQIVNIINLRVKWFYSLDAHRVWQCLPGLGLVIPREPHFAERNVEATGFLRAPERLFLLRNFQALGRHRLLHRFLSRSSRNILGAHRVDCYQRSISSNTRL